ncbi:type II secretion system major pseudopilin GspG [Bradyrhizobium brasilense]|uniref:Type II secretion system core protein G n=1 Tax=Bradyrhizobium brasilense TaxID=1419277 RepID=A0ABY8JRJ6_9BRAD|nr:type II secretion system major pseudopilin GspG [Bradyrhizobium brasilense]WFU66693.1 type II secretion system major pseudopilin GspG [Bradyrhizobium brasilense]
MSIVTSKLVSGLHRGRLRRCKAGQQDANPRQAGFTLIEVLVVLVIIGLIMGLVAPRALNYLSSSKEKAAHLQIKSLAAALDLFYLDMGRYPLPGEGLRALVERPANVGNWSGPYLKDAAIPADPWGRPYLYRAPGARGPYDIVSLGSSGQDGAPDNISSAQP